MRPDYKKIVEDLKLLPRLERFSPVLIGTPPLGIATEESDIDIACSASDLHAFIDFAEREFGHLEQYACAFREHLDAPAVVVQFFFRQWPVEIFCQQTDTLDQAGVRHFFVEKRLLDLEPRLGDRVLELRRSGAKTEPAFCSVLKLEGDPYDAILELEKAPNAELLKLIARVF